MWYARSEAFLQQDFLQTLRWVRTFGDVVFIVGAFAMGIQVVKGLFGIGEQIPQTITLSDAPAETLAADTVKVEA